MFLYVVIMFTGLYRVGLSSSVLITNTTNTQNGSTGHSNGGLRGDEMSPERGGVLLNGGGRGLIL